MAEERSDDSDRSNDLSNFGLGYGINGSNPNNLLYVVVRPVRRPLLSPSKTGGSPVVVDEVFSEVGCSSFVNETYSKSKFTDRLASSLSGGTPSAINLNMGANYGRTRYREQRRIEVGCQYVGREYRLQIPSDAFASPTKTEVESLIYNELGQREFSEVDPKEIEEACMVVLKECLYGATHFVSAVKLGAKIYEDFTTNEAKDLKSGGANVGAGAALFGGSKIGFSFAKDKIDKAMQKHSRIRIIAGPSFLKKLKSLVQKKEKKSEPRNEILAVEREDEAVISRFVLPISSLIRNYAAREAMNRACREFLDESICSAPPLLDRPLLLSVGRVKGSNYYFSLDDDLSVVLTHKREKATPVYLDIAPVKRFCLSRPAIPSDWASKTNVAFRISFIRGGRKYYMGMSSSMPALAAPRATSTPARAPRSSTQDRRRTFPLTLLADSSMSESAPPPHSSESGNIQRAEHEEVPPTLQTSRNLLQALFVAPSLESTPSPPLFPQADSVLGETAVLPDEKRCIGRLVVKSSWVGQDQERCRFYVHSPCDGLPTIPLLSWLSTSLLCLHIQTGIFTQSVFPLVTVLGRKPNRNFNFQKVSAYFLKSVVSESVSPVECTEAEVQDYQRFCQYYVQNVTTEEFKAADATPRSDTIDGSRGGGSSVREVSGSHQ